MLLRLLCFHLLLVLGFACSSHADSPTETARLAQKGPPPKPPPPWLAPDPICPTAAPSFPPDLSADSATSDAGASIGSFSVTPAGEARFALPLAAVPGRAGMQPSLSLEYDGSGDGLAGLGFSLSGFSRITRCPKNRAEDGAIAPVAYDPSDAFCLDGRRLIKVLEGAGYHEYRTSPESFSRIRGFFPPGFDASLGPLRFEVKTRKGLFFEYGSTSESRVLAANGAARAWWIHRSTDPSGNFIEYEYQNDAFEILPSKITYTHHPKAPGSRSVLFHYDPRPAHLIRTRYQGGQEERTTKTLSAIDMRSEVNLIVRRYRFAYQESATTSRMLLSEVKECAADGVCKPPTRFDWKAPPLGFDEIVTKLVVPYDKNASVITTDLDGDGREDLVMADADPNGLGVPVTHWYSARIHAPAWKKAFFFDFHKYPTPLLERATPLDFDQDGRLDLLLHDVNGNRNKFHVLRSKADGTFEEKNTGVPRKHPPEGSSHLVDMDGDGMPDIVTCEKTTLGYAWTFRGFTGQGYSAVTEEIPPLSIQPCETELHPVDLDGDGKLELLVPRVIQTSDGSPLYLAEYDAITRRGANLFTGKATNLPTLPPGGAIVFLDVNGDGLPDAVQTGFSNGQPFSFLNTGAGFMPAKNALPGNILPADTFARLGAPLDYDGDGLEDWLLPLKLTGNTPRWSVLRSRGDGTFSIIDLPSIPFDKMLTEAGVTIAHPFAARVLDENGDGASDVLLPVGATFRVYRNRAAHADVLASFTDGLSQGKPRVEVQYSTLADSDVYERGAGCEYPLRCVAGPRRVVRAVSTDQGGAEPKRQRYFYKDARFDRHGRGFLGFAERILRDPDDGSGRIEIFDPFTYDADFRAYPFAGTLRSVIAFSRDLRGDEVTLELFFTSILHERFLSSGGATYFTRPWYRRERREQAIFSKKTLLGSIYAKHPDFFAREAFGGGVETSLLSESFHVLQDLDAFGNPLVELTFLGDRIERVTRTFQNDPFSWQIGLFTSEEHCSEASEAELCRKTERSYDTKGRVKTITQSAPNDLDATLKLSFERDAFGNITKTVALDAFGGRRASCTSYTADGIFPLATGNALGHVTVTKWSAGFGLPLTSLDPNGFVTQWAYDGFGRIVREKRPDGTQALTSYVRDAEGAVHVRRSKPGFGDHEIELDRMGRTVRQWTSGVSISGTLAPRILRETRYDARGLFVVETLVPTAETTPLSERRYDRVVRDSLGRIERHVTPFGASSWTIHDGHEVRTLDARGGITVASFNALGKVEEIKDAEGGITRYAYGPFGFLREVTDPGGSITKTEHDAFGRVRLRDDPSRGQTVTRYSGFGEPRYQKDALGREIFLVQDGLGRLIQRDDSDGTTRWVYDTAPQGIGQIHEVESPLGHTKRWAYDGAGRPIATELSIDGETFSLGYGYDAEGRLASITYPGGFSVSHQYDAAGHLLRVRDVGAGIDLWELLSTDGAGRITKERFGNGVVTTRGYDVGRDRVQSIVTSGGLQHLAYGYDASNNLAFRADLRAGREEAFVYDKLNRLRCAAFDGETPCARAWDYAPNGNLLASPEAGDHLYEADRPQLLAETKLGSYQHDAVGNQIARPSATLEWTAFDLPKRLIPAGGEAIEFAYDGDQQRIRKASSQKDTIQFDELYERERDVATGETLHRYSIAGPERPIAIVTREGGATRRQYLHVDHLGSIDVVSNEEGAALERRSYAPFGQRRDPEWGGSAEVSLKGALPLGFTGHVGDEELGLVFMRGRVYDPGAGRFLSPDPLIANPYSGQSYHGFAYVENNPLSYVDPSGFTPEELASGPYYEWPVEGGLYMELHASWVKDEPSLIEAAESGALRAPSDFGSWGNTTAFRAGAAAPGSERDTRDVWDKGQSALGGFFTQWGEEALGAAVSLTVMTLVGPTAYVAYTGYSLHEAMAEARDEGLRTGGFWGRAGGEPERPESALSRGEGRDRFAERRGAGRLCSGGGARV